MRQLGDVSDLAESLSTIGLLQPIVVGPAPDHVLVSGAHRVQAARRLGWSKIPALILDAPELDRELAEVDENLIRHELTVLERAEHLLRRKELYELRFPAAKHGGAPGKPGGGKKRRANGVSSFAHATGSKLSVTPRSIQHDVQIAEKIANDVKATIRSTPVADSKRDLLALARLEPERQRALARTGSRDDLR
jgi:ParB family chromosome partitioning protein